MRIKQANNPKAVVDFLQNEKFLAYGKKLPDKMKDRILVRASERIHYFK